MQSAAKATHTLADRRRIIRDVMEAAGIERLVCVGTGHHMIDLANPIAHLLGYRSVGPAVLVLESDGEMHMLTSPADDVAALHDLPLEEARAVDDLTDGLPDFFADMDSRRTATFGLAAFQRRLAGQLTGLIGDDAGPLDQRLFSATAAKTVDEVAAARRATGIAEAGFAQMRAIARPGMRECDLAVEINFLMRELGANDSFLMLNCGPRADAVMPSSERPIEDGDLLLCELSPSVDGQFTQICRTMAIGGPKPAVAAKYDLLVAAMNAGIAKAEPGATVASVCLAIDDYLSDAGYAQYARPPFIRRRGHGLGSGSTAPGDVSVDNETVLEPGMLLMVHPNQFLPETGYMMCGEPVLVTAEGREVLSRAQAAFAVSGREV